MVFTRLTDMSAAELQSLSASAPLNSIPLNALKKFAPKIRKVTLKYPKDHFYTITGGAKYAYQIVTTHILDCCKAGKVSQIGRRDFIDSGNIYNAFKDLEMNYFANNIYHRMEAMAAGPLISVLIGEVYHEFDDEHGIWVRAMAVKGIAEAKTSGRLRDKVITKYYAGKVCKAFDDDVIQALAEKKVAR